MANLTKDQVKEILINRPKNTSAEEVVQALLSKGHTLEGFTPPTTQSDGIGTKVLKVAAGAVKSLGETAARTTTRTNPVLSAVDPFIPEKVDLPVLGETSLKYSSDPLTMAKQGGEDLLNVFPGGGESKILKSTAKNAWAFLLQQTSKSLEKNPKLAEQAAETGITAITRGGIIKKAKSAIQYLELGLDDLLSKSEGKINGKAVAEHLDELKNAYTQIPGEQNSVSLIEEIQKQMAAKGELGVKEANELKRTIYQKISNSYGKGVLEIPAKTEAQKVLASGIRQEIEKVIPEVKDLNAKQAVYIQIKNAIERTIRSRQSKGVAGTGIGLYDLVIGGAGTIGGVATGNPLAGAAAVGGKKFVESAAFMTNVAKMANYFNKLSPTKKLLMYQTLRALTEKAANLGSSDQ